MLAGVLFVPLPVTALTLMPATPDERVQSAAAICHATVLGAESFRGADGGIRTRTWLRVTEALKGTFPATFTVVHRGGRVGDDGEVCSDAPDLKPGEERLFLLGQRADGTLFVDNGSVGAPLLARTAGVKPAGVAVTDPNALALLSAAEWCAKHHGHQPGRTAGLRSTNHQPDFKYREQHGRCGGVLAGRFHAEVYAR